MLEEVHCAVEFIGAFFRHSPFTSQQKTCFKFHLQELMLTKFSSKSWSPELPDMASAYRALFVTNGRMDELLLKAAQKAQLPVELCQVCFPKEFILWVDPGCVSFKLGEYGSIGMVHKSQTYTPNSFLICAQMERPTSPAQSPQVH